jgi:tetratricopeptide (TPR) repeat protein
MRTIYADFNAMTEAEHVRLSTRGSQEDMRKFGIQIGDWVWLSDGELIVGAQVADDPDYGVVGIPDWETLVHLDDEDTQDFYRVNAELQPRLQQFDARTFQLLTILEQVDRPETEKDLDLANLAVHRANCLESLSKLDLALHELEEARRLKPGNGDVAFHFLHFLLSHDPTRALGEATKLAEQADPHIQTLVGCISVLSSYSDQIDNKEFHIIGLRILDLTDRFDRARGRDQAPPITVALVQFDRGLVLLRMGRIAEARHCFDLAKAACSDIPEINELKRLDAYDQRARNLAAHVRSQLSAA